MNDRLPTTGVRPALTDDERNNKRKKLRRYEDARREHLGNAVNLTFGLDVAAVGFCASLLTGKDVQTFRRPGNWFFITAVIFFTLTILCSMFIVWNRLQWAKDNIGFGLHIAPSTFTTSGLQLTDVLSYLGFQRQRCPFLPTQDGYCDWIDENTNLNHFANAISQIHESLSKAERHFNACGLRLPQPERFGYFLGKQTSRNNRLKPIGSGDGHTSPTIELRKLLRMQ